MAILKRKHDPKGVRYAGTYISQRTASYLGLFSLAKGVTKSSIIRRRIEEWIKKQPPVEDLIRLIIARAKGQYLIDQVKDPSLTLHSFLKKLRQELRSSQLEDDYIELIISKVHEENKKSADKPADEEASNAKDQ